MRKKSEGSSRLLPEHHSPEEFHRLKGDRTGQALVAVLQASPCRDIEIEPKRERLPVRHIKL